MSARPIASQMKRSLRKMELVKDLQGVEYPTNAMILLSDDPLRNSLFHYAKVECARFKGVSSDEFIDQKSITVNIALQAEETYLFVLRHINKGASVEGVYTVSRWEYPVKAIREVIRNCVLYIGIILLQGKMSRLQFTMTWWR